MANSYGGPSSSSRPNQNQNQPADPDTWIAIDLGTSSCAVGVLSGGRVHIIPNENGKLSTPSFVAFTDTQRLVGAQAQKVQKKSENLFFEIKRVIGSPWHELSRRGQDYDNSWPFDVVRGPHGRRGLKVTSHFLSAILGNIDPFLDMKSAEDEGSAGDEGKVMFLAPEEVLAMLFAKMRTCAESFLMSSRSSAKVVVTKAVVTVPGCYNDMQREATKLAATIAGFTDVRLLHEPTAAALAYAHHTGLALTPNSHMAESKIVLFFVLGGGCLDVAVVEIAKGRLRVIAATGNPGLGGRDFDEVIVKVIKDAGVRSFGKRVDFNTPRLRRKMKVAAEKAKKDLTLLRDASIEIDSIDGDDELSVAITRKEFNARSKTLIDECERAVDSVLKRAQMGSQDVQEVVLVGGSTRIPELVNRLKSLFGGREPRPHFYQDEAVVHGAVLYTNCRAGLIVECNPRLVAHDRTNPMNHLLQVSRPIPAATPALLLGEQVVAQSFSPGTELDLHETVSYSQEFGELVASGVRIGQNGALIPRLVVDESGILAEIPAAGASYEPGASHGPRSIMSVPQESLLANQTQGSAGKATAMATERLFRKVWQPPATIETLWSRAQKITEYEENAHKVSEAKHRWEKLAGEVEKQLGTCPPWTMSIMREEIRVRMRSMEQMIRREDIEKQCDELADLCEYVFGCEHGFGLMWTRSSTSRRKFFIVDSREQNSTESVVSTLRQSGSVVDQDMCDIVVSSPVADLFSTKKLVLVEKRIEVAAPNGVSRREDTPCRAKVSAKSLRDIGIPYVIIGPPTEDSPIGAPWQVVQSLQAGLRVILRLGGTVSIPDGAQCQLKQSVEPDLAQCKEQLKKVYRAVGSDWRNIVLAYQPAWSTKQCATDADRNLLQEHVVAAVYSHRAIRQQLRELASDDVAESTRIIFGGAVTVSIWEALSQQLDIDGFYLQNGLDDPTKVNKLRIRRGLMEDRSGDYFHLLGNLRDLGEVDKGGSQVGQLESLLEATGVQLLGGGRCKPACRPAIAVPPKFGHAKSSWLPIFGVSDLINQRPTGKFIIRITDVPEGSEDPMPRMADRIAELMNPCKQLLQAKDRSSEAIIVYVPMWANATEAGLHKFIDMAHGSIRTWLARNTNLPTPEMMRIVCGLVDGSNVNIRTLRQIAVMPNVDGLMLELATLHRLTAQ